jgi:hypothetical protein
MEVTKDFLVMKVEQQAIRSSDGHGRHGVELTAPCDRSAHRGYLGAQPGALDTLAAPCIDFKHDFNRFA